MKLLLSLLLGILICGPAAGLDPFFPPEEWEAYQQRILKDRAHEKPAWERPKPGMSPAVAIQTLILPEFAVENGTVEGAFDAWRNACRKAGVNAQVFIDPATLMNRPMITHVARGQTAANVLSYLENLSLARVRLVNDVFLAGIHDDLDPHAMHFRVWVLDESVEELLKLNQPKRAAVGKWIPMEDRLGSLGAAFPYGTYADYHSELRLLVVINTKVTLDAISELITETQAQALIRQFKDKGPIAMKGYSLEVRRLHLQKKNAAKIHARFKDEKDRLVPFAVCTEAWAKSRGLVIPLGGAAWLDRQTSTLWIRSRPDALDDFSKQIEQAQDAKGMP